MRLSNPSMRVMAALLALLWGTSNALAQTKTPAPTKQPDKTAPASKSTNAAPAKSSTPQTAAPAKTQPAPAKTAAPAPKAATSQAPAKTSAPVQKAPAPKAAAPKAATPAPKAKAQAPKAKAAAPKAKGEQPGKAAAAAEESVSMRQGNRRDPFEYLVGKRDKGPVLNLPAGKAGLVVATMRLDGVVRHQAGMIAVVSNPQQRVYFLREGDRLYDGRVERISMDGIVLRELSKDAFGKPLERVVTKRIYPSAGEQQ